MTKKILSPLGFAALFVLGAPATAYSDSLPAIAARTAASQASCISMALNSVAIANNCGFPIHVLIPVQSRNTGNHSFVATAPQADQTQCNLVARDFFNNPIFQSNFKTLNGRTGLGFFNVTGSSVILYDCILNPGKSLTSVDYFQF